MRGRGEQTRKGVVRESRNGCESPSRRRGEDEGRIRGQFGLGRSWMAPRTDDQRTVPPGFGPDWPFKFSHSAALQINPSNAQLITASVNNQRSFRFLQRQKSIIMGLSIENYVFPGLRRLDGQDSRDPAKVASQLSSSTEGGKVTNQATNQASIAERDLDVAAKVVADQKITSISPEESLRIRRKIDWNCT
ncbi:hypothetical protein CROQUDRAFT_92183 [Cronartium quercuum f. sp. fusiforme G11]|uniref:Uncharacterized protein n=1 Tax=Cronartium quercuum f. sp. fusiforme G11 TaxID=708437 RepID=A0A9P6TC19_9BASI|nr:hypothetical protein CROQUDRAFT_92183 [Cronartium quercuum f. sp. fusiforme G11]